MPTYKVIGNDIQAVVCDMNPGETIIAESGHLLTLSQSLQLNVASGGLMSGLKRVFGGSSFFVNKVSADAPGQVTFSSPTPGHVVELDITPTSGWMCQPHVFLCGDDTCEIGAGFTQRLGAGLFGGTGFILQSVKGRGKAFIHVGGANLKFNLQAGQSLRVSTGALAAFQDTVTYDIQMVRGLKSILFSGEGLWFANLTGPGTVIIQSLSLPHLASSLLPYLPRSESGVTTGQGAAAVALGGILGSIFNGNNDQ